MAYEVKTDKRTKRSVYQNFDQIENWFIGLPIFGRGFQDKSNGQTIRIYLSRLQLTEKSGDNQRKQTDRNLSKNFRNCMLIFS